MLTGRRKQRTWRWLVEIETEDDYNEQNDMMETDEEPFDMEKDQNPMRLSTRPNGTPRKKSSTPTIDKSVST